MNCYCDQTKPFSECCEPILLGTQPAADPATLMRSRYSAFASQNADYILASWHPKYRPKQIDLDPEQKWIGLKVIDSGVDANITQSRPEDSGWVKFVARYKLGGRAHRLEEHSLFSRVDGRWYYFTRNKLTSPSINGYTLLQKNRILHINAEWQHQLLPQI